jgi:hypothetical protein
MGIGQDRVGSNDNDAPVAAMSGALPAGALAIIEPWPIGINQGGRARRRDWRLRFAPRARPFVDLLTGWTGGSDPLAQIQLCFPSREAAERYCKRQGIRFRTNTTAVTRIRAPAKLLPADMPPLCCWPTGPHALCCGDYPIVRDRRLATGPNEAAP